MLHNVVSRVLNYAFTTKDLNAQIFILHLITTPDKLTSSQVFLLYAQFCVPLESHRSYTKITINWLIHSIN